MPKPLRAFATPAGCVIISKGVLSINFYCTKTLLFFALILVVPSGYSIVPDPENKSAETSYSALGTGQSRCSKVVKYFEEEKFRFLFKVWLSGYLTAMNSVLHKSSIEFGIEERNEIMENVLELCGSKNNGDKFLAEIVDEYWRQKVNEYEFIFSN